MAETEEVGALEVVVERVRELADTDGTVHVETLKGALGAAQVTPALLRALEQLGYSIEGQSYEPPRSNDPLDLYLAEMGGHRLLSADEEKTLARGLAASRIARNAVLLRWPGVRNDLMNDDRTIRERLSDWNERIEAAWASLWARWEKTRAESTRARLNDLVAEMPWSEMTLNPYVVEVSYRFRQVQEVERNVREVCLRTTGMTRRYFDENRPVDLFEREWLAQAVRRRTVTAKARDLLVERLSPLRERLDAIVRAAGGLSPAEIRQVFRDLRAADREVTRNRDSLSNHNLRLVISIARRHARRGVALSDLVQEGNLGLLRAIDKFDPALGFRFSTYATWWIRQAVGRAVAEQARTVRVPGHVQDIATRVARARDAFEQRHARTPTDDELAKESGLPIERLQELQVTFFEPLSLEAPLFEDRDEPLSARIQDESYEDPEARATEAGMRTTLDGVLSSLRPQAQRVIRLRYGIGVAREHTLKEVGEQLGVTRERVRQIERAALAELSARGMDLRSYFEE